MTRKIARYCDIVMELGWLLTVITIPIYFNIYTSRVFEPDKITILRSFTVIMVAVWLLKVISTWAADRTTLETTKPSANRRASRERETVNLFVPDGEFVPPDQRPFLEKFLRRPLLAPAMFLCFLYLISTILSVVPGISWWGSYQRLQGTYTFYSYVMLFLILVFNIKEHRQIERIISFVLLINVPITIYGVLQHNNADPLPWQGDTTLRVTSTMGNAIFISAYLIMCVPFALYRSIAAGSWLWSNRALAKRSMNARNRDTALSWVLLYGFFTIFELGLFYAILQFNASYRPDQTPAQSTPTPAPGSSALVKANETLNTQGSGIVGPWWALPMGLLVIFAIYFLFTVRRQGTDTNYLFRLFEFASYISIFVLQVLVIIFSQSRGPEAGLIVGLFIIAPLLFWRLKMWRRLGSWMGIGLVVGGFLVLFNLPPGSTPLEPVFKVLRANPELNRFSQLAELNDGTGKVRSLIWKGDFGIISGAAQSDQLRLLIGFGPESLYQISPTHYQPELAHVEARNAIPDRSHNGYLDSIITTGFIGLLAYIVFVVMYIYTAIRLMFKTNRLDYQILLACLVSMMIAHQIEIQVGIQIVATWTMFWTGSAILVLLYGLIHGSWARDTVKSEVAESSSKMEVGSDSLPAVEAIPEPEPVAVGATSASTGRSVQLNSYGKPRGKQNRIKAGVTASSSDVSNSMSAKNTGSNGGGKLKNNETVARTNNNGNGKGASRPEKSGTGVAASRGGLAGLGGVSFATSYPNNTPSMSVKPWFWAVMTLVVLITVWYIYISNFIPIQGDVIYKEAINYTQIQKSDQALPYFEKAVQVEPSEDFYRLYLGESYLEKAQNDANNQATASQASQDFEQSREQLIKAHELAPLNADHLANLGRLYSVWSSRDPNLKDGLNTSIDWFKQALVRAPYNAHLYDELSQVYLRANKPNDALQVAQHSVELDQKYDENRVALGNAYLAINDKLSAGKQFAEAIKINPKSLDDVDYVKRMEAIGTNPDVKLEDLTTALTPTKDTPPADIGFYNVTQGILDFYHNKYSQAENLLNQVLSSSQTGQQQAQNNAQSQQGAYSFYAHLYLAQVYAATSRSAQAETEAQTALSIVNNSPGGKPLVPIAQDVLNKVKAAPAK